MTISSGESMDNIPVPEDEKLIIRCFSTPPGPLYSFKVRILERFTDSPENRSEVKSLTLG